MQSKKKLQELANCDLRSPRPYLDTMCLEEARFAVRLDTFMIDCAGNMKKKYMNRMLCENCDLHEIETQQHIENCPGYEDIKSEYDTNSMIGKVKFFRKVMLERATKGRF